MSASARRSSGRARAADGATAGTVSEPTPARASAPAAAGTSPSQTTCRPSAASAAARRAARSVRQRGGGVDVKAKPLGVAPRQIEDGQRAVGIVQDQVRALQPFDRPERQQVGGARARVDQADASAGRARSRSRHKRRLDGAGCLGLAPLGEQAARHVACPFPKATTLGRRDPRRDAPAQGAGKSREAAEPRLQRRLDQRLDPPRQHRRRALGADGDHDGVAIDDRRHDDVAQGRPVDDIDQRPALPRQIGCDRIQRGASRGDHDQPCAGEGRRLGNRGDLHRACPGDEPGQLGRQLGRHDLQMRGGAPEQARLLRHLLAAADEHDPGAVQVDEEREVAHGTLRSREHGIPHSRSRRRGFPAGRRVLPQ